MKGEWGRDCSRKLRNLDFCTASAKTDGSRFRYNHLHSSVFPLDLHLLQKFVDSRVRQRGAGYAASGRVELAHRAKDSVLATVSGSREYSVHLRYADATVYCLCDCPYFEGEVICKHVWAVLIECQRAGVAFSGRADVLYEDDPDALDVEIDDSEDDAEEGEDADQLEIREIESRLSHLRTGDRTSDRGGGRVASFPGFRKREPPKPPSQWRGQLARIQSWSSDEPRAATAVPEITWVIDPSMGGDAVVLEATKRPLKKNGEIGKPQALMLVAGDIAHVADPVDREILASLLGSYSRESRLAVRSPLAQFIIPKVVATGRILMRVGKGLYEDHVAFDAGDPFVLTVKAEERDEEYVLVTALRRGDEFIPLSEALGFSPDFVFFRGRIARIANADAARWARLIEDEGVAIPRSEIDDFIRSLSTTASAVRIDFPPALQWHERKVKPRGTIRFRKGNWGNDVIGTPEFAYEGHAVNALVRTRSVYDENTRTIYLRDSAEEQRLLDVLWGARFGRWSETVTGNGGQLAAALPTLVDAGWEVEGEEGSYAAGSELELSINSGIDWFDLNAGVTFGSERITLPRLLAALKSGATHLKLGDGRIGLIRPEWKDELEPFLAVASEERSDGVRFRKNQVLLLDALLATRPRVSLDSVFEKARRKLLEVKVVPEKPPKSFRGTLRPYQSEGVGWFAFLRELGFGGCLADDMGLGKTVQVLALLEQRRTGKEKRPSLVVAPRSVVFNWKNEAERFTPKLRLLDHSTPDRLRASDHFSEYDVIITTYALLRREIELLSGVEFDYVVLDESQAIKNASSQSAKAATLLKARHRLALSGTPIENHLGELGSLFEFLNPGMLRGKSSRMMKLLRGAGANTPEAKEQRALLAHAVRPFILRRTKAQVATELPERTEQTIYCDLEPAQRKLYNELRDYYRASLLGRIAEKGLQKSKIHVLEALLRMRQAACHPALVDSKRAGESSAKIDVLFERLPVLIAERHKVLVFSQFTSMLAIVRREMEQRGMVYAYLDGKSRDRSEQVRRFQEETSVPVFLVSLKAGGLGLNLTAAEYVYLLDPWWNPAVEAQAIDRAHRIGQTRNVFAYRLVARETIEEKILLLQQSKRALADAIISEENSILRNLTAEDLELLLS